MLKSYNSEMISRIRLGAVGVAGMPRPICVRVCVCVALACALCNLCDPRIIHLQITCESKADIVDCLPAKVLLDMAH